MKRGLRAKCNFYYDEMDTQDRMIGTFSQDSEQCRKCNYYQECNEKRMELCAYIIPDKIVEDVIDETIMNSVMPNTLSLGDYEIGQVDTKALLENVRKEIENVFNPCYWTIRGMYDGKNK